MHKADLVNMIVHKTDLTARQVEVALTALVDTVQKALSDRHPVKIPGLGQFSIVKRAARQGRHPRTGEPLTIPETLAVKFSPWQDLRLAAKQAARQAHQSAQAAKASKPQTSAHRATPKTSKTKGRAP